MRRTVVRIKVECAEVDGVDIEVHSKIQAFVVCVWIASV